MKTVRNGFLAALAALLLFTVEVNAQQKVSKYGNDSVQCVTHFSLYREFYKQKNFADAIPHWRWVFFNCPQVSQNLYIDGAKIISYMISESKDAAKKDKLIDTLMMVYDKRVINFGSTKTSRAGMVYGRQALDLNNFRPADTLKIYSLLRSSIEIEGTEADPVVVSALFITTDNLIKGGRFGVDSIANAYDYLSDLVDNRLGRKDSDTAGNAQWSGVKGTLEAVFEPYATCDQLVKIYSKKFEKSPSDTLLLQKMLKLLDKKDCDGTELYYAASEQLYKLKPSGNSAYNIARRYSRIGDNAKASAYYLEAIPALDDEKKAKAYYALALINFADKDYSSSRSFALKSLAVNPNDGKCYILIGNCYAATAAQCGSGEIAERAGYWAAVDKYNKAKQVDNNPDVINEANSNIATYSRHFPKTERLFFNDFQKGQSYTINCWYSETTTVRSAD